MQPILVTDHSEAWSFLKSQCTVLNATDYLANPNLFVNQTVRIINLCKSYQYQSIGYYVSLLAEARLHAVSPLVCNIQDTVFKNLAGTISQEIDREMQKTFTSNVQDSITIAIYFGKNTEDQWQALVAKLYEVFPLPLLQVEISKKKKWQITAITPLAIENIPAQQLKFMQEAARCYFAEKQPPQPRKKSENFKLAILTDPHEGETATSNVKAIEQFVIAGEAAGLQVDLITKKDAKKITDYDALFIRTTTAVNHYTYQMARHAATHNLVVIDDPQSIIRCTNKVFLAEIFNKHNIPTPYTQIIRKDTIDALNLTFPCVLKRPDSSCSLGVVKLEDLKSFKKACKQFFQTSDLLLVQAFMPTEFDWRIGIIDNKPLYACRYYMAKNHWQIVDWSNDDRLIHDAVAIDRVPEAVLALALKATQLIGNGFYGVDIKTVADKHYMIEINDNPSINFGIEDVLLKTTLYEKIIDVFLQRLRLNGKE